ncbi:FAD-dependent oxidoreductase [cyanobiont of Ornithocercus magnificus]|nr:FAD-dependent oxidoreductase [cyanobiont of Ornithocercus magnificus]
MLFTVVCTGMFDTQLKSVCDADLIVIGAGATGAAVAYEACRRGLRTVLLEQGDIGCATSCRSTKLLHGGVRYLELAFKNFDLAQLRLVREALIERGHWLRQAPFLTRKLELALPTSHWYERAYYSIGLNFYDALAGTKNIGSSRQVSRQELQKLLPKICSGPTGGVAYTDCQFDDARLNLLLALTAERAGAIISCHSRVIAFEKDARGRLNSVLTEGRDGSQQRWRAQAVVNATGIQADNIRQMADPAIAPRILTSRGVHIVLEASLCPEGVGMLLPTTEDGRVLFVLPFFGRTLVGTTDTPCPLDAAATPSRQEQSYLIEHVRPWFPDLGELIISSCWAGGRPLLRPASSNMTSNQIIREHEVETMNCGLVSVMGGKWTTCRLMAEAALEAVETFLEKSLPLPANLPLVGAAVEESQTLKLLAAQRHELRLLLPDSTLQDSQLDHLQSSHGLEALALIQAAPEKSRYPLSAVIPLCQAEIDYAINSEHAQTPTDVLARRCRLAMVDLAEAHRLLPLVQRSLQKQGLPEQDLDIQK